MTWQHLGAFLTGAVIGFLGGLFGKGGSAAATPLLSLLGFPGFVAVASPLPATVPSTVIASAEYWRSRLLDWEIVWWSIGIGTPAIVAGSFLSHSVSAKPLLVVTGVLVLGFGLSFLFFPKDRSLAKAAADNPEGLRPSFWRIRLITVATGVGLISGLSANAGGFLLAPSYTKFLKQPMKKAFACSLAVSSVPAIPGTIASSHHVISGPRQTDRFLLCLGSPSSAIMLTLDRRQQMRGNEKVVAQLNAALSSELTAIVQYMTQSEMCQNWGYKRLGQRTKARAIEEMKHAEGLIERIIFLDEVPSVDVALKPQLGSNVQQQMEVNLKDEHDAVRQYNQAAKVCVEAGDEGSRVLFEQMIKDEERHVDYLEAQLHSIEEMGIANYLAEHLHE